MASTNSYFTHDSNARNDEKIIKLRMRYGAEGYGIFFMLLERMREETDYTSVKDYNMLAFDFRTSASLIKSVVEDFGLFSFTEDGERIYSESFLKRMEIKDEKSGRRSKAGQKGAAIRWGDSSVGSDSVEAGAAALTGKAGGDSTSTGENSNAIAMPCKKDSNAIAMPSKKIASKVKESKVKESKVKESKDNLIGTTTTTTMTAPRQNSPPADPLIAEIVKAYQQEIDPVVPVGLADDIRDYTDRGMEPAVFVQAIHEAAIHGKHSLAYVRGILRDCMKSGTLTLEQWQTKEIRFQREKLSRKEASKDAGRAYAGPSVTGNFKQREYTEKDFSSVGHSLDFIKEGKNG